MHPSTDLFLIRHAAAAEGPGAEPAGTVPEGIDPADAARPLTPRGARRFSEVVAGLRRANVSFDRLYYSPLLRAVQTAEILDVLVDGESVVTPALAAPPSELLLRALSGSRIAVVGHQPWLGELLGILTLGTPEAGRAFRWKKGGVAWLEGVLDPAGMTLRGFWAPRILRREG